MKPAQVAQLAALLKLARDEHGMVIPGRRESHWPERQLDDALSAVRRLATDGRWYVGREVQP